VQISHVQLELAKHKSIKKVYVKKDMDLRSFSCWNQNAHDPDAWKLPLEALLQCT